MADMYELNAEEQNQEVQPVEREEIEDDQEFFIAVDELTAHGINAEDVKKLKDAGIYNCDSSVIKQMEENLTGIEGLSEAILKKIIDVARSILVEMKKQAEKQGRFDEFAKSAKLFLGWKTYMKERERYFEEDWKKKYNGRLKFSEKVDKAIQQDIKRENRWNKFCLELLEKDMKEKMELVGTEFMISTVEGVEAALILKENGKLTGGVKVAPGTSSSIKKEIQVFADENKLSLEF